MIKFIKKYIVKHYFIYDYPCKEDYKSIRTLYDFEKLMIEYDELNIKYREISNFSKLASRLDIDTWIIHFNNRIIHVRRSFEYLMFYYNKGIPDSEWRASPGNKGQTIEYFPNFTKDDFINKAHFDFFSDFFFYKIFSAFDTLGQILNELFDLEIKICDFNKSIQKLKSIDKVLYSSLNNIYENEDFKTAKKIRNNIAHNYLPNNIDSGINRVSKNEFQSGTRSYVTSKEIKDSIFIILELLHETIPIIKGAINKYSV